jgi:hypothetical protein
MAPCLFFHSPSKGAKNLDKSLELWIKTASAYYSPQSVSGVETVYFDTQKTINAELLSRLDLRGFLTQLCTLYVQYHHCGLPFDMALAEPLAKLDENASVEDILDVVDNYWHGDGFNAGAKHDTQKRIYFGAEAAVRDECMQACCLEIVKPLMLFEQMFTEARKTGKADDKKNSREAM